jgi:predicted RNA methylase
MDSAAEQFDLAEPSNELVSRSTISQICAFRDKALIEYAEFYDALEAADQFRVRAVDTQRKAAPLGQNRYNHHAEAAKKAFLSGVELPDRDDFMETARKLIDTDIWSHLIEYTSLERLMDKKAKDEFANQLKVDPPEATEDNVRATMKQFFADSDTIWKRGIAEAFSNLDRRFRSHDGWKIGSRIILSRAFDEWGHWNHHRSHRDTFMDIERVFYILDGREPPAIYGGLIHEIDEARSKQTERFTARQTEVQSEFYTIRIFKNGNAHIWFRRDDLLEKVNKLLGEYYGEVIPEDRDIDETEEIFTPKTTPAKRFGFFPTPDKAAETLIDRVPLYREKGMPPLRVLEPSAGTGNLARRLVEKGAIVDCVEVQPELAEALKADGRYSVVLQADFISLQPSAVPLYDQIVMNPPFDLERDIDHVYHALKFLKPDGSLHAIMSAGVEFRQTRKAKAFRELVEEKRGVFRDLPPGSFAETGTYVNTVILRINNSGQQGYW